MASTRHRPKRGHDPRDRNPRVYGEEGEYHPQGGARQGQDAYRESGDLSAREFGTPQADIPGGVKHLVNAETVATRPAVKPERPADYHKYHGVPSDDGLYAETPGEPVTGQPKATPLPRNEYDEAVPVRIVQGDGAKPLIRTLVTEGPVVIASAATIDPVRLADRDSHRVQFWICNETTASAGTAPGIRIGDWETCADGRGLLIPAATIKDFVAQDAIYLTNQSGSAVTISWGYETETEATNA